MRQKTKTSAWVFGFGNDSYILDYMTTSFFDEQIQG